MLNQPATTTMNQKLKTIGLVALGLAATYSAQAWDLKLGQKDVTFHGFLSQGFLASGEYDYLGKTTDGSFDFTEVGINAAYSPFNRTRIAVQGFAFDAGQVGNLEPFLDYASLEYTFNDKVGLRGGRVRRPGGLYNHIQDVDLARTSVLLPQGIYDARWRDFSTSIDGGIAFGNLQLGKAGSLSYELFCGVINLSEDGGVAKWILDGQTGVSLDQFGQPLEVGGQLWWNTPVNGLRAGVMVAKMMDFGFDLSSPATIPTPDGPMPGIARINSSGDVFFQQYSLEYVWKSWTFQAEYFTYEADLQQVQNVYLGPTVVMSSTGPQVVTPDAWYVSAAYRFNKWLEAGAYYTEYYADRDNRSGNSNSAQKDLALSLRFDARDWWIIKVEGHLIHGTALLQDQVNNPPANRDEDAWFLLALKTTFSF